MAVRYHTVEPPLTMQLPAPLHTMRPHPERLRFRTGWYRGSYGETGRAWYRCARDGRVIRFLPTTGALELVGILRDA